MKIYLAEKKEKRKSFWQRLRLYFTFLTVVAVGASLSYWLFFSSFWEVQSLEVEGLEKLKEEEIINQLRNKISQNNFWLWPKGEIAFSKWPLLAKVTIEKDLFRRLVRIIVQERKAIGVWCVNKDNQQCYWFDKEGIVFDTAPKPEGSLVITVEENNDFNIKIGQPVLTADFWQNMTKIINSWLTKEIAVSRFIVDRQRQEVAAEAVSGLRILLSLRFDPAINLEALRELKYGDNLDLKKFNYFDLRVKNRLYYK